jgi:hypothetical protein
MVGKSMTTASYAISGNKLTLDMRQVANGLYFIRVLQIKKHVRQN